MNGGIATRLRELRQRIGFSRRSDMAQHLGLPSSTYSAYEGEAGPPKVEWLVELGRRGVNLNWLLTGTGDMMLPPHAVDTHPNPSPAPAPAAAHKAVSASPREPELDTFLLAAMIRRVEREAEERSHPLTAMEKGEMIARLYAASARLTESELAGHTLARAAEGPDR